jgi:hypothetical protein
MKRVVGVLMVMLLAMIAHAQSPSAIKQAAKDEKQVTRPKDNNDVSVTAPPSKYEAIKARERFLAKPTGAKPPIEVKRATLKRGQSGYEAYLVVQNTGHASIEAVVVNFKWVRNGVTISGLTGASFNFKPSAKPDSEGVAKLDISGDESALLSQQDCYDFFFMDILNKEGWFMGKTCEADFLFVEVFSVVLADGTRWDTETARPRQ